MEFLLFLFFYSKRGIIYKLFSDFLRMRTSFEKEGLKTLGVYFISSGNALSYGVLTSEASRGRVYFAKETPL